LCLFLPSSFHFALPSLRLLLLSSSLLHVGIPNGLIPATCSKVLDWQYLASAFQSMKFSTSLWNLPYFRLNSM
jgi:hypothetical protein